MTTLSSTPPSPTSRPARTPTWARSTPRRALDLLRSEAEALADRAEHVSAEAWSRKAKVAGDGERTALDVLREAVRTTAAHLRRAERARGRS